MIHSIQILIVMNRSLFLTYLNAKKNIILYNKISFLYEYHENEHVLDQKYEYFKYKKK